MPDMQGARVVIVMALYNDWESAALLLPRIDAVLQDSGLKGRIVIVDDGTIDDTGKDALRGSAFRAIDGVVVLELFRNLGNQRAVAVAVGYCADQETGDYLIVMDGDGEDDPAYIPQLVESCSRNGRRKIVFAERTERSEGKVFTSFYTVYKFIYRFLTGLSISIGNYSAIPWKVVPRLARVGELWAHFPAAIMRARLPFDTIPSVRGKRQRGKSSMSLVPLILHALSGFSVHSETVGSRALLVGAGLAAGIFGLMVFLVGLKLFTDIALLGWTSQILTLLIILLVQIVSAAGMLVFLVVTLRTQLPMLPIHEYAKFVMDREQLYPAPPQTAA